MGSLGILTGFPKEYLHDAIRAAAFVSNFTTMAEYQIQTNLLINRLSTFEFLRGHERQTLIELSRSASCKIYAADAVIFWEGYIEVTLILPAIRLAESDAGCSGRPRAGAVIPRTWRNIQ